MASKSELDSIYMGVAKLHASLSKAQRMHVGACMVLSTGILVPGVNGLPRELGNVCEEKVWESNEQPFGDMGEWVLKTKIEVIHAEEACILKAAKEGLSVFGSTIYITHPPCRHCASMMIAVGVTRVVYDNTYRDLSGLLLLKQAGRFVDKFGEIKYD